MKNPGQLKIGYYNTVYSTEAKTLKGFLRTHFHHYLSRHDALFDLADPQRAMDFVDSNDFDLVVLSEILGRRQRIEIQELLKERGYKTFYGKGHGLADIPGDHVEILLATRIEAEAIALTHIDVPASMGHGGGIVAISLPDMSCDVYGVHLALTKNRETLAKQIEAIVNSRNISKRGHSEILMGDFNVTPSTLRESCASLVDGLELLSPDQPTCSTVWPISRFYNQCVDQIWGRGFNVKGSSLFDGESDHRGVVVNLLVQG